MSEISFPKQKILSNAHYSIGMRWFTMECLAPGAQKYAIHSIYTRMSNTRRNLKIHTTHTDSLVENMKNRSTREAEVLGNSHYIQ